MLLFPFLAAALTAGAPAPQPDTGSVRVAAAPAQVWIEEGASQLVNFDLMLDNRGRDTLEIIRIELSVYDRQGVLELRKIINENGSAPSVLALQKDRVVAPGARGLVFNPFYDFPPSVELATLRYDVEFRRRGVDSASAARTLVASTSVTPRRYMSRTRLALPMRGRLLVWDGHDFYSHHRRVDLTHLMAREYCITANAGLYSFDFVVLGAGDSLHAGAGGKNELSYSFGQPVLAPAAGRVVLATDGNADNGEFDWSKLCASNMALYGNTIAIDHGNGEFSVLGHLQRGSVRVRVGDQVTQGQQLASVGSSGSSLFPHLHYQLVTGIQNQDVGLPAYFPGARVRRGGRYVQAPNGQVDTGDIVESR